MVEVGSGTIKPLADAFQNLASGISGEAWTADADASPSNWVNQYLDKEVKLGAGLDLASLLSSLGAENVGQDEGDQEVEMEKPAQVSTPASPVSSDSSCQRSMNQIPRHKRPSHKRAELKRRGKIKTKLDDLKAEVPKIADKEKLSESVILSEAADFTKNLKAQCEENRTEAGNLRQEIESLSAEIHKFQELLPAAGLSPDAKQGQGCLDQMYKDHVASRTRRNWKFFIFSFFFKPLFESYKEKVNADSQKTFMQTVTEWSQQNLSLSNLRHVILNRMRDITRETDIMSHPESLQKHAMASIGQVVCDDTCGSTAASQPSLQSAKQTSSCAVPVKRPAVTSTSLALSTRLSTAVKRSNIGHIATRQSSTLLLNPIKQDVSVIPTAGHQPFRTASINQALNPFPVITCPTSGHPTTNGISILARGVGAAQTVTTTSQNPVSRDSQALAGFPVVATSLECCEVAVSRPTAIVAPIPPVSRVAHFITEFDHHKYDFDITDIPIPDLSETLHSASQEPANTNPSLLSICVTTVPQSWGNPIFTQTPSIAVSRCQSYS